ncbi:hypothetical protein OS493_011212 [Desmophyllum pertusum]|uniref:Uncharacterized protein n=1 Tax=Desmophyllum pertusum TaxID=174260 RepID=A0A9W9Z1V8_9CNID|nr:hypothetical protein OS493_011212 [Desmophyllum pertusum]
MMGPKLPHPIVPNISYRFWHAATVTFLKRDPVNGAVSCIQDDDISATAVTAMGAGKRRFAFIFKDNAKNYALNAEGRDNITATEINHASPIKSTMKFKPSYYWSFTVFRNIQHNTLYLGCDNRTLLLVPMNSTSYPDPRALFITTQI